MCLSVPVLKFTYWKPQNFCKLVVSLVYANISLVSLLIEHKYCISAHMHELTYWAVICRWRRLLDQWSRTQKAFWICATGPCVRNVESLLISMLLCMIMVIHLACALYVVYISKAPDIPKWLTCVYFQSYWQTFWKMAELGIVALIATRSSLQDSTRRLTLRQVILY